MYNLVYDEKALQNLEKLEKKIRKRIFEKITSTKENPFHYFERLTGRSEFKLRIGDYRVIADPIWIIRFFNTTDFSKSVVSSLFCYLSFSMFLVINRSFVFSLPSFSKKSEKYLYTI